MVVRRPGSEGTSWKIIDYLQNKKIATQLAAQESMNPGRTKAEVNCNVAQQSKTNVSI